MSGDDDIDSAEEIPAFSLEEGLEEAILEYALSTFPYKEAFDQFLGHPAHEYHQTLTDLLDTNILKIGFYYEEMQESLIIFYFLCVDDDSYVVLGLNPEKVQVNIPADVEGIFRLDEDQYVDILQIPLC